MLENKNKSTHSVMTLTPPEVLTPIVEASAPDMVPLVAETTVKINAQVTTFLNSLLTADVQSDAFRARLDSAFRLGREEIANAASLMTGRFMERNFVGVEDTNTFKSLHSMRTLLNDLNPGKQGDLFQTKKLFGIIPLGNKLQEYFRKYQSAGGQLQAIMAQIYASRDDMQRDATEIERVKGKLWEVMQKLKGAIHFAMELDKQIAASVDSLKSTDAPRAQALEQEVLFYVRQNLQDMQTQMAVNVNGYLAMEILKKTAREMINGCNRVATTGMSALATAQTVARATGNQIQVMEMLNGMNSTISDLVSETSCQLGAQVEATGEFSQSPMIGIEKIQEMFDNTFKAMDAMDTFRSKAIDVMGKNNELIKNQISRSDQYIDRVRANNNAKGARKSDTSPSGIL